MIKAKPFLKWAGGKRQLLNDLVNRLPKNIRESKVIENYIEPFVGGGSFFFYLQSEYQVEKSLIIDINPDLVLTYNVIKSDPNKLISELTKLQGEYYALNEVAQQEFFYRVRKQYNEVQESINYAKKSNEWINRASQVIFLNRTCFNGLFRQNKKGEYNVPFGKHKKPLICDEANIVEVSKALATTEILCGDFSLSEPYINKNTLIYLDPPYRPIKQTSSFTSYAKDGFTDEDQKRLAEFYRRMDKKDANLILSNSDPQNVNSADNFFEILYKNFCIDKVSAKRNINSHAGGRGKIPELMITNYNYC